MINMIDKIVFIALFLAALPLLVTITSWIIEDAYEAIRGKHEKQKKSSHKR